MALRKGEAELVLQDLGAAGPQGIRRAVERARELWRVGRVDEARWRLRNVVVPRELFPAAVEREAFWAAWSAFFGDPATVVPYADIDPAFRDVLARVERCRRRDLPGARGRGVEGAGPRPTGDVKGAAGAQGGRARRPGRRTWNTPVPANPQRSCSLPHDGYLLALYTARQADAEAITAFASVRRFASFRASRQRAPVMAADPRALAPYPPPNRRSTLHEQHAQSSAGVSRPRPTSPLRLRAQDEREATRRSSQRSSRGCGRRSALRSRSVPGRSPASITSTLPARGMRSSFGAERASTRPDSWPTHVVPPSRVARMVPSSPTTPPCWSR